MKQMKFFVDTADTAEIRDLAETGLLDGVTTNPSLIHKAGRNFLEVVEEIASIVPGPVSAEVVALEHKEMMREAEILRKIADNIAVKVPLTVDGLKTRPCSPPRPARPSSRPLSAATTISASTGCRSSPRSG